jgi:mRNA interferase RelE/StbE
MKIEFLKQFSKDLAKITDENLKKTIIAVLTDFQNASNISEIPNIKKMKGHPEAYRVRVGKYRLGFYFDDETIEFARCIKREDIYKLFP